MKEKITGSEALMRVARKKRSTIFWFVMNREQPMLPRALPE